MQLVFRMLWLWFWYLPDFKLMSEQRKGLKNNLEELKNIFDVFIYAYLFRVFLFFPYLLEIANITLD